MFADVADEPAAVEQSMKLCHALPRCTKGIAQGNYM